MEFTSNIKRTFYKICIAFLGCCIVLWFSVFSYALLYYLYIPAVAHVKPVHLKYDISCYSKEKCAFPYDNITLVETDQYELLARGQAYAIEIILDMPETQRNIDQGMFMVRLDILSEKGVLLRSSHRPNILRHKSPLFKVIYTLFFAPALLAGTTEEKQSLAIPLFEKYEESFHQPSYFAFVQIQAQFAEIYSCSLRIHAQFTGLRYMMYYWPILSAIVGIGSNFTFISTIIAFVWVRQIMYAEKFISLPDNEKGLIQEIRLSMQQSQTKNISSVPKLPKLGAGTKKDLGSMHDDEEIETISPHRGRFRTSDISEMQDSSSVSDEEFSFYEGESNDPVLDETDEVENVLGISKAAESTSSPGFRRRHIELVSS